MIVGVPPYDAPEVMSIIEMHSTKQFPEPATRNPAVEVSRPTVDLIKKMMEKRPEDRFDSWLGFIEAAEKALKLLKTKNAGKKNGVRAKKKTGKNPVRKKKRNRSKSRPANLISQKKSNPIVSIISYLLMIVVGVGIAYIIYDHRKIAIARESLNKAEHFILSHPGDYDSIIDQFRKAKLKCKGTEFEKQINKRLSKLEKEKSAQEQYIREYKEAKKQANQLAGKKNYEEALKVLINASKNIDDPALLREADRKIQYFRQASESKTNSKN